MISFYNVQIQQLIHNLAILLCLETLHYLYHQNFKKETWAGEKKLETFPRIKRIAINNKFTPVAGSQQYLREFSNLKI